MPKDLFTPAQVAAALGYRSSGPILARCRAGEMGKEKFGHTYAITRAEIKALVERLVKSRYRSPLKGLDPQEIMARFD